MTIPDRLAQLLGASTEAATLAAEAGSGAGTIPATIHEAGLADLLGITTAAVRYAAGRGAAVRVKPGHYDTRASVAAYCEAQRARIKAAGNPKDSADLQAAKLRAQTATAEKLELANAKARGDMVESSSVEREWAAVLRDLRSALLAVPSRIGANLPHLSAHDVAEIDREIKATLEGLANGA